MAQAPYEPVNSSSKQIRLLVLHGASKSTDPIVCVLSTASLGSNPRFEALSYTWGDKKNQKHIVLNGDTFLVRENVEAALRRLRYTNKLRILWVDAICVNQRDDIEKNEQVLLMRQIYESAERVCIWLGEPTDASHLGVKCIQSNRWSLSMGWYQWKLERKFGKLTLPARESFTSSVALQNWSNLVEEQDIGEVKELLARPWWYRAWIIQEAVVARKLILMCGSDVMDWDNIETTIKNSGRTRDAVIRVFGMAVNEKDVFPDSIYRIISSFRNKWANKKWDISIYELLYEYRRLECSLAHDRLYAFLGLASTVTKVGIHPDYTLPAAEIYRKFARTTITKLGTLDILNCTREWRGIQSPEASSVTYSLIDQARYHDIHAVITDGPGTKPRRGWARLPHGWERFQSGKCCYYLDHSTGERQEKSPLERSAAIPAQYYADQRFCPKGCFKYWDNLGRAQIEFKPRPEPQEGGPNRQAAEREAFMVMPSWVPNWAARTSLDPAPLLDWSGESPHYWAPGRSSRATVSDLNISSTDITLEGFVFDHIEFLTEPWHPTSDIPPFSRKGINVLESWEAAATVEFEDCPYAPTISRREALWRTMIADKAGEGAAPADDGLYVETWYDHVGWLPEVPDFTSKGIWETESLASDKPKSIESKMVEHYSDLLSKTPAFMRYIANNNVLTITKFTFSQGQKVRKKYGEYIQRIYKASAHRRFFCTRRGYMGLAPWNAQQGDLVCLLNGGKTPFLLRPMLVVGRYKLVGEVYVHGIMGGEALEMTGVGIWQMFTLI